MSEAPPSGVLARADAATRAILAVEAQSAFGRQLLSSAGGEGCRPAQEHVRRLELAAAKDGMFVQALGDVTVEDVACWVGAGAPTDGRLTFGEVSVTATDGGVEATVGRPERQAGTSPLAARFVALRQHAVALAASVGPPGTRVEVELTADGPVLDGWVLTFADEATARAVQTELDGIFARVAVLDPSFGSGRPTRRGRAIDFSGFGSLIEAMGRGRLRSDLVEAFRVPAASMLPTLHIGDYVFVVKPRVSRPVERGDVVVVLVRGRHFIKRVVGFGGDTVTVDGEGLVINGERAVRSVRTRGAKLHDRDEATGQWTEIEVTILDETIGGRTHQIAEGYGVGSTGTWSVPAGHLFLMGDYRDNSNDSREWGTVAAEELVGIARVTWFSVGRDWVDWDRVLTVID